MTQRRILKRSIFLALSALLLSRPVFAEEVGCATTTWKLIGANHRVCVYAYDDPKIPGVTCLLAGGAFYLFPSARREPGASRAASGWPKIRRNFPSPVVRSVRSPCRPNCRMMKWYSAKIPRSFSRKPTFIVFWIKSETYWCIWRSVARLSRVRRPTRFRQSPSSPGLASDKNSPPTRSPSLRHQG